MISKCDPEEQIVNTIIHYISSIFAIPIYGTAFLVLLFRCPKLFNNQYRYTLLAHIFSGVLLEIHMGVFWRGTLSLPFPILCSHGLASEYPAATFQTFIYLLMFTGISALSLLIYRMNAVIQYADCARCRKVPIYFQYVFYIGCFLTVISTFLIIPGINNQMEYKMKMEKKFGTFPEYFWCGRCFFLVFDSIWFILFFIFGYIAFISVFLSAFFALFLTFRILNSNNLKLSLKTVAIQKNVVFSLAAAIIVHILLIFIPLSIYFLANLIVLDFPGLPYIVPLMVQEHGSCSTLALVVTSNLLRKAIVMPVYFSRLLFGCRFDRNCRSIRGTGIRWTSTKRNRSSSE